MAPLVCQHPVMINTGITSVILRKEVTTDDTRIGWQTKIVSHGGSSIAMKG
ncbi:MAG: hypothetical protein HUJ13_00765 [Hydrogenovibrio crunogenus]|nr:hypothetical protein [Hydrogenovibrio crunogenus]